MGKTGKSVLGILTAAVVAPAVTEGVRQVSRGVQKFVRKKLDDRQKAKQEKHAPLVRALTELGFGREEVSSAVDSREVQATLDKPLGDQIRVALNVLRPRVK